MLALTEIEGNVLNAPNDVFIVHCISADFKLGAGVAAQIDKKFNTRNQLLELFPNGVRDIFNQKQGMCIQTPRVLNLVTKELYFYKPNYHTMSNAIQALYTHCIDNQITNLAMPRIGCGLDGLRWELVKDIIKEVFTDGHPYKFIITVYNMS